MNEIDALLAGVDTNKIGILNDDDDLIDTGEIDIKKMFSSFGKSNEYTDKQVDTFYATIKAILNNSLQLKQKIKQLNKILRGTSQNRLDVINQLEKSLDVFMHESDTIISLGYEILLTEEKKNE